MFIALAIFASVVGLFATGAAIFTAWAFQASRGQGGAGASRERPAPTAPPSGWLLRWTVADYATILLFGFGFVFLLVDLIGVIRDRELYPLYHYGYLLCGFIFTLMGMLFAFARLAIVIWLAGRIAGAGHQAGEPDQAEQAE